MEKITFADIVGLTGVTIILFTYFLLQIERIKSTSLKYSFLNVVGSTLIFYSLLYNFNLASVIIEIFWICISLYGIYKWYIRNKKDSK